MKPRKPRARRKWSRNIGSYIGTALIADGYWHVVKYKNGTEDFIPDDKIVFLDSQTVKGK